jgi:hypothetical protein
MSARSELAAIGRIVGVPYGLDGLPVVERVVMLKVQLQFDDLRCRVWEAEANAVREAAAVAGVRIDEDAVAQAISRSLNNQEE